MLINHDLSIMHGNKKLYLYRIHLNLYLSSSVVKNSQVELVDKILNRALEFEKKSNSPCMHVPVRASETRKLLSIGFLPSSFHIW